MSLKKEKVNSQLSEDEDETVEILSPEAIAAMLDDSAAGDADVETDNEAGDDLDDLFGRLAEEEIPAAADNDADTDIIAETANTDTDSDADAGEGAANDSDADTSPILCLDGMLSSQEIDILGEIGNISMGAVATTMYSLLDRRVSITTPRVTVFDAKKVLSVYKIPFVVATIEYVEGISGNNLLVLKVNDAAMITDILMGGTGEVEEPAELNDLHLSAMSEIMNQMMGASSTSLSKLLQKQINISPPKSSQVDAGFDATRLLGDIELVTKISFDMEIEGLLKSELIQLIPYDVSREFAKQFIDADIEVSSEGSSEKAKADAAESPPRPEPQTPTQAQQPPVSQYPEAALPVQPAAPEYTTMQQPEQYPGAPYPQDPYNRQWPYPAAPYQPAQQAPPPYTSEQPPAPGNPQAGRLVDVHPVQFQAFDAPGATIEQRGIDLVYNIPLQVTVELGKTKKEIAEILEFGSGTIVVLDKIAGDPVEIVVNGKLIARGEVVVIDENYGVRITDIVA